MKLLTKEMIQVRIKNLFENEYKNFVKSSSPNEKKEILIVNSIVRRAIKHGITVGILEAIEILKDRGIVYEKANQPRD